MKNTLLKITGAAIIALLTFSLFTQTWVSAQEANSKGQAPESLFEGKGARVLEGAWSVQVTLRVCQTGVPIRTFPRMNTFMQGGTMQEFAAAGPPSLRGPGQGIWSHSDERNFTYAIHFLRFAADGTFNGSVRERRSVEVNPDGSTYNATGTGEVFDANGNLIVTTCATEAGTRFE